MNHAKKMFLIPESQYNQLQLTSSPSSSPSKFAPKTVSDQFLLEKETNFAKNLSGKSLEDGVLKAEKFHLV